MSDREPIVPIARLRVAGPAPRPTLLRESPWALRAREAKRALLTARRLAEWQLAPTKFARPTLGASLFSLRVRFEERVSLARTDPHAQPEFERGKRHNVRLAASAFDGLSLGPETVFSFWRTLGPALASRGFVAGMELRGGCVVPSIGGGLCLLSNALFRLCLAADFVVHERHGHTLEAVPLAEGALWGADATVAYAHIDLRFAPRDGRWTLRAHVTEHELVLSLEGDAEPSHTVELFNQHVHIEHTDTGPVRVGELVRRRTDARTGATLVERVAEDRKRVLSEHDLGRNCVTCNETSCHAREAQLALISPSQR